MGLVALALGSLCLVGCEHHFFKVKGALSSEGGELGTWSVVPEGCSRDPLDRLPVAESTTVMTLFWQDPRKRDRSRDKEKWTQRNYPLRFEVSRSAKGVTALLDSIQMVNAVALDQNSCSALDVQTWPGARLVPEGRPTSSGTLTVDCQVRGSHVTAKISFSGCEY